MAFGGVHPFMLKKAAAVSGGSGSGGGGDGVTKSLRISAASQHYLRNTGFATGSANGTFTLSCWIKRTDLSRSSHPDHNYQMFYWPGEDAGESSIAFQNGGTNAAKIRFTVGGGSIYYSSGVFRDIGAWAHILVSVSSGTATVKYNGETVISGATGVPTWGTNLQISRWSTDDNSSFGGYIADVYGVDGMALDYTDFTTTDATTGQLKPIAYSGDVGTDGFHLDFKDADAIGNDVSGNDNDFSTANLVPADVMDDNPSAGMNYCVYNAVFAGATGLSEGNLKCTTTARGTFDAMSFASYWEITANTTGVTAGVESESGTANTVAVTNGSTFGFRLLATGALDYTSNGSSWTNVVTGLSGVQFPYVTGGTTTANFGQSTLSYSGGSGGELLSTAGMTATIAKPAENFDVLTYSGSGAKTFDNGTTSMQPDLVWVKARGDAYDHELTDSVRGVTKALSSNATNVESTDSTGVTAFGSDGFTVGAGANYSTSAMVAWAWKAGTSFEAESGVSGSGSKNPTAGFGISTWTGTGEMDGDEIAVAHGCGGTPELVIAKDRDGNYGSGYGWLVWHHKLSADNFMVLNTAAAETPWDSSYPLIQAGATNTTFGLDSMTTGLSLNDGSNSMNGETTYVAYAMRSIEGYSKVGGWSGSGVSGKFIYTGFRPAFILAKRYDSTGGNWLMFDDQREGYNVDNDDLFANDSGAENTTDHIDILSNGFKIRTSDSDLNTGTVIYYAVGQSSKYANAR